MQARTIDSHAHYDPRMLDEVKLLAKLDHAGVERVVLIPCMNDPLPETPKRLLAVVRQLARRAVTRPLCEVVHRATLTPEGDLRLSGRVFEIYRQPDNDAVADLCARHPGRISGWMFLNPRNNPRVLDDLERLRTRPGMVGVKLHPHWHDWRTELAMPLFRRIEELGLPLLIHLGFRARGDYRAICERFPKLRVIAAHAGFPFFDDLWRAGRDTPNLFVDLSSPYLDEALVRDCVRVLGPEWCLYGTDAPYGFHEADGSYDYQEILRWVERLPLSEAGRERVLHDNAHELLRL